MNNLIIFTPKISTRIKYVLKILFEEIYQINYQLVDNIELYKESEKIKINYSANKIQEKEILIYPSGLLNQRDIKEIDLKFFITNDIEYIFKSPADSYYLHDIFSAIFYLISRYEEYLPHLKDKFGRYLHTESIAYKKKFLRKPIVNIWADHFIQHIKDDFPILKVKKPVFKYISTIDIDNAFLIHGKGFVRSSAFLIKSVIKLNIKNIRLFISVLFHKGKDPLDTYSFQFELQKKYNLNVKYFFLLADYGLNDKNLSYTNSKLISLIKRISDIATVGIHPSFASNSDVCILEKEISRLEAILKREVLFSRQHFLKLSLPKTYKQLLSLGITEDFTMGYASILGFRAGIASPFSFYDLDMEQALPIKIFPFAITDDILRFNLKLEADCVINEIQDIVNSVKQVNGTLITVWHNNTFSNFGMWKGWKNVYEEVIKFIVK